jgi:hypothetical protein
LWGVPECLLGSSSNEIIPTACFGRSQMACKCTSVTTPCSHKYLSCTSHPQKAPKSIVVDFTTIAKKTHKKRRPYRGASLYGQSCSRTADAPLNAAFNVILANVSRSTVPKPLGVGGALAQLIGRSAALVVERLGPAQRLVIFAFGRGQVGRQSRVDLAPGRQYESSHVTSRHVTPRHVT